MLGGPVSIGTSKQCTRMLSRVRPEHDPDAVEIVEGVFLAKARYLPRYGAGSNDTSRASPDIVHFVSSGSSGSDDERLVGLVCLIFFC